MVANHDIMQMGSGRPGEQSSNTGEQPAWPLSIGIGQGLQLRPNLSGLLTTRQERVGQEPLQKADLPNSNHRQHDQAAPLRIQCL